MAKVSTVMRVVRKRPMQVWRDVQGLLANRIQHAMMREATRTARLEKR